MAIWLDGVRSETPHVSFDLSDRGLLLGDGVFDTAMAVGGRIVFRDAHLGRLAASCAELAIPLDTDFAASCMDAAAAELDTGSVRVTVTRGSGPRGVAPPAEPAPRIIASNAAGPLALLFAPVRLFPSVIRRNETSPAARLKTLNYLDQVVAAGRARAEGFEESLFLNTVGQVACAGTGNIFAIAGNALLTPPLADGVLAGVTRGKLLELAREAQLEPAETSLSPDRLADADAVFMTNSLRLIAPVTAIGGKETPLRAREAVMRLARALCAAAAWEVGVDALSVLDPERLMPGEPEQEAVQDWSGEAGEPANNR